MRHRTRRAARPKQGGTAAGGRCARDEAPPCSFRRALSPAPPWRRVAAPQRGGHFVALRGRWRWARRGAGPGGGVGAVLNPFSRTDPSVRARRRPDGPGQRRPPARPASRARGEVRGGRPGGRGCTRPRAQRGAEHRAASLSAAAQRLGRPGPRPRPPPLTAARGAVRAAGRATRARPGPGTSRLRARGCAAAGGARLVGRRRGRPRRRRGAGRGGVPRPRGAERGERSPRCWEGRLRRPPCRRRSSSFPP